MILKQKVQCTEATVTRIEQGLRYPNQLLVTVIAGLKPIHLGTRGVDRDALLVITSDWEDRHTVDGQYGENVPDNAQWSGESKPVDKEGYLP